MANVEQIKAEINTLKKAEYVQLRQWFSEKDWHVWDQQVHTQSEQGTLDFLIEEAISEKEHGSLKDL